MFIKLTPVAGMKMGPGKKNSGSQGLTPAGKVEHAIVAQAVEEIIGPRLDMEVLWAGILPSFICG